MDFEENTQAFSWDKATRQQVPALIALWGASGSGKTYTALMLARGLVGQQGTIAVVDTENKRAAWYADEFNGWHHINLAPPFTTVKYTSAFDFCVKNGADVIIVDSASHVWEGEGGVLDQANQSTVKGVAKWKDPKIAHKKMMNALIRSPKHVIFCLRQKELMRTTRDEKGKEQYVFDRFAPIAEKNFIHEMTVAFRMTGNGFYDKPEAANYYKVPSGLGDVFPIGGRITLDSGKKLAA